MDSILLTLLVLLLVATLGILYLNLRSRPKDENEIKEAEEITKIIKFFREEMYPAAMIAGNTGISAAFRYPSVFDIKMKYKTSDGIYKDVATKLLPCFLQAVDVNYNQTGMSFHSDGKPQQATLTLSFTEQRALTEYDVAIGGY